MNHDGAQTFLLLVVFLILYLLPTKVAESRHKRNIWAIFTLNLLLGWTVVGWIAAMVWALTYDDTRS